MSALRTFVFAIALAVVAAPADAQGLPTPEAVARAIDDDVWRPMLRASDAFDAEAFLAVLSPDLVRISADRHVIYGLERYAREIREGFPRAREHGLKRTSTARFHARTQEDDLARDVGIFQSTVTRPDGTTRTSYTAFEMVMRREQGRWTLLLDRDSWRDGTITEAEFLAGAPMTAAGGDTGAR